VVGNKSSGANLNLLTYYNGTLAPERKNVIVAFNSIKNLSANFMTNNWQSENDSNTYGFAIYQNVFEKKSGTDPLMQLAADASVSRIVTNGMFLW
jgi:hypothetical protein